MKKRLLIVVPMALAISLAPLPLAHAETLSDVVINEVESNGDPIGDWIELANTDTTNSVDISGWSFVDNDPTHEPYVFPEGTIIESGGYISFYTEDTGEFGLGGKDSVTLFDAAGEIVDFTEWNGHADTTWGRVPDMSGDFAVTGKPTKDGINLEAGEREPIANAELPFHNIEVKHLDLGENFVVEDMSGADFDSEGQAWIVNNDAGDIYLLDHDLDTDTYSPAGHWQVTYPDGSGTPDGEGITVATDGSIYLATERNNEDKDSSRPSILRFDAPNGADGILTATDEWNLSDFTGVIGANSGLETIAQIEETIFAVGVEGTGEIIVVDLASETPVQIQTFQSEVQGVMALDYNAESRLLHVLCDEVCEGASQFLTWNGTEFTAADDNIYARPAQLGNFANEGFASYTAVGECTDGEQLTYANYLWADDSVNGGISLRSGQEVTDILKCDTDVNGDDEVTDEDRHRGQGSSNGSSGFAAGSVAGSLATGIFGAVSVMGVVGGLLNQILIAFPALKNYIRF
ncbi:lamin tail domain-containing protein [uncultured Corynebacterium sp.]|uniref:lamin tail domain-containing protein n=1 Tax=uncultured Corynebacterium sp. TaxID=159447 RepID=UPI0034215CB3